LLIYLWWSRILTHLVALSCGFDQPSDEFFRTIFLPQQTLRAKKGKIAQAAVFPHRLYRNLSCDCPHVLMPVFVLSRSTKYFTCNMLALLVVVSILTNFSPENLSLVSEIKNPQ